MQLGRDEVFHLLLFQLGALSGIASAERVELRHVKPHGALYNQACSDPHLADAVARAVRRFSGSLALVGLPGSRMEDSAAELGLEFLREGFADRRYEPSGLLRDRKHPDSLLADPELAAEQAVALAAGHVLAHDGQRLALQVDTLCIHGDTPGAPEIARRVRATLQTAGVQVTEAVRGRQ
jgi:UPF0271 protein